MSINRKRVDPRIVRTRQLLRQALVELIGKKGFAAITVKEICQTATLNKATFYLHYKDKEDLLIKSTEELLEDLTKSIVPSPEKPPGLTPSALIELMTVVFEHFERHEIFYDIVLNQIGTPPVIRAVQKRLDPVAAAWMDHLQEENPKTLADRDVIICFTTCSYVGLVQQWLAQKKPQSAAQMAQQWVNLIAYGSFRSAGIPWP